MIRIKTLHEGIETTPIWKYPKIKVLIDEYYDELKEAERYNYSHEKWWQIEIKEKHEEAAKLWVKTFNMDYETAYAQFAKAVGMFYNNGQFDKIRVDSNGIVMGLKLIWSGMASGDHMTNPTGEGVKIPDWVKNTPGVIISGSAHLIYAYIPEY